MKTTTNYGLKKPDGSDLVNIEDLNANADSIDTELSAKEGLIKSAAPKNSLADADTVPLSDSAASNVTKKITFTNLKGSLKAYFDTMYNKYSHPTTAGNKHIPSGGAANQVLKYGGASGTAVWGDAASGKIYATLVVGTSASGHTAADVDYLCDGTDDQVEINAAIAALPSTGGKIVIREGTYNIAAEIDLNKANVTVEGMGSSTILKRMWNSTLTEGVIGVNVSADYCIIKNVCVDGNKTAYPGIYNYGILLLGSHNNKVTGNTCNNNYSGIYICFMQSSDNIVTGNTCNNNFFSGILINGSGNTVTGNTCNNNYLTGGIDLSGSGNTVTGNTCNNNNNSYGIELYGGDNTVTGNTCNNNSCGINLVSSSGNILTGNMCNNNNNRGIRFMRNTLNEGISNNTVTGNTCNNNNNSGILFASGSSGNTITGNTCIRGTGLSSDYTSSQYTIQLYANTQDNLVTANNIMGKAVTDEGTNNTVVDNKSS